MAVSRTLAAPLLLLAAFGAAASAAPRKVIGIAAAVVNDVRIRSAAAGQFARAVPRQRVALADQVQTGSASRLQLVLLDRSTFTVGPNARLTIDRFVYDPDGGSFTASVAKGAFRFLSGRTKGRRDATINSPSASIGIRGTLLDGAVGEIAVAIARGERELQGVAVHDPATATLAVLRGPGPARQGGDPAGAIDVSAGGQTVALDRPLQAAYVPRIGATPIAFTLSLPALGRLNDMVLEPRDVPFDPDAAPNLTPDRDDRRYDYPDPRPYPPYDADQPPRGSVIPTIPVYPERPSMPSQNRGENPGQNRGGYPGERP